MVGGGGAGLPAALFSRWNGNDVMLIEKATELGGTARKAAFWYWVPNNEPMRAAGMSDPEEDFLRYTARLTRPELYDAASATLGLTAWEHSMLRAIYASSSTAAELLKDREALVYRHCPDVIDYWSQLPEDAAPRGRVLVPAGAKESMADGGMVGIASMAAAARRDGVTIRTGHRVQRVVTDGRVIVGVEATSAEGSPLRVFARKGVIFASGGFAHNDDLRVNFLKAPVFKGATCSVPSNEGDFVQIASRVGAQLRNMNNAWMGPMSLDKAVAGDPGRGVMSSAAGDSTIFVDPSGRRRMNEKLQYNELAQSFFLWDGATGTYPNLVMIQLWDQRSQDHSATPEYGRMIVPPKSDSSHVVRADTLEELARLLAERLDRFSSLTGGVRLSPDFVETLTASVARFNSFAAAGVDEDFARGELPIEVAFNGAVKEEPGRSNPTMWPISSIGPYYAGLVVGGILDTKGGPRTTVDGQVLDDVGEPIAGLYGVGNCVASVSAGSYWAGGATLGPMIAFAYRAAQSISAQPARVLETN